MPSREISQEPKEVERERERENQQELQAAWLLFSCSVVSDSLWPHGLQHARLPSPSLSPRVCSNSCPSNHLILYRPLLLLPIIFLSIKVFSNESALSIRWPKYWSFSFSTSPSNDCSWLISFRMDWVDLLAVQGTLKSMVVTEFLWSSGFPSINGHLFYCKW